jgi:hypothetical protein
MGPVLVSRFNEHGNQVGYYAIKSSILTKTKINFYPKPGISILLHIIDRLRVSDHKGGERKDNRNNQRRSWSQNGADF